MNKNEAFIETKEYKRFAEFCDACTKYKYIGFAMDRLVLAKRCQPGIIPIGTILRKSLSIAPFLKFRRI